MMSRLALVTTVFSGLWLSHFAFAEERSEEGIAEGDASVIFAENFETGSLAEIAKRWGHAKNKNGKVQAFSNEVPPGSAGRRSLEMTGTFGENSGGDLYTTFKRASTRSTCVSTRNLLPITVTSTISLPLEVTTRRLLGQTRERGRARAATIASPCSSTPSATTGGIRRRECGVSTRTGVK